MEKSLSNRLKYYPVGAEQIELPSKLGSSFMLNVLRTVSYQKLKMIIEHKHNFCDSGGLQIIEASKKGKKIIVGPMLRTRKTNDYLTIGTIDNCRIYRRTNSALALMIDRPVYTDDSDAEYWDKLSKSRKARNQMLRVAKHICPATELVIAIQARDPLEVQQYFSWIYTPYVRVYAYPIRRFRNRPNDALGNAYVLSFLSSVGIKHVHFLGSNAPVIIFLLAKAIALKMFEKASFDSLSWNQSAVSRFLRYLHPYTLTSMPQKGSLHQNTNMRTELAQYSGVFEATLGSFNPPEWVIAKEWCGFYNIKAIEEFKNTVLSVAMDNNLDYFIEKFEKYSKKNRGKILKALKLLEESKDNGHDYIKRKYKSEIEELYC